MKNAAEYGQNRESEPQVTLPLSALQGLLDRTTAMSIELDELRATLAGVIMSQTVQTQGPVPTADHAPAPEPAAELPKTVTLFSGVKAATAEPLNHLDKLTAQQDRQSAFRLDIQTQAKPYVEAIAAEFRSKAADKKYTPKQLPPMPNYTERPEVWRKYVEKHGQHIKWSEGHGDKQHDFSLTFLPRQGVPELVAFDSKSRVLKRTNEVEMMPTILNYTLT